MSTTATAEPWTALYVRKGKRGPWRLAGVYPTYDQAREASTALPDRSARVWLVETSLRHLTLASHHVTYSQLPETSR